MESAIIECLKSIAPTGEKEPFVYFYKINDVNILALVKQSEVYTFIYDAESRAETLRTLGRFASNLELSFTWYDAAELSQKIRQEAENQEMRNDISSRFELDI